MGHGLDAPEPGPQRYREIVGQEARESDDLSLLDVVTDGGVGLPVANDHDAGAIEVKIVENPAPSPVDLAEDADMLEPAPGEPPNPPFRRCFVENDEPLLRLEVSKAISAEKPVRTHRVASLSCEP